MFSDEEELLNSRFMHFWDLVIDNHISEAIEFFKNPKMKEKFSENDLEMTMMSNRKMKTQLLKQNDSQIEISLN
jgi:hypothetical protein